MTSQRLTGQWGVLGSLLIDAPHVAGMVFHGTREEDFTGELKTVYQAARRLFLAGRPIDAVTVGAQLGPEYSQTLIQLMDYTSTAANVEEYINLTVEEARKARVQSLALSMQQAAGLEDCQAILAEMGQVLASRSDVRRMTLEEGFRDFYDRQVKEPKLIPWGFESLDEVCRVELGGDFFILGGYPSAGKTALSLQLAWNQAKDYRVGYFSLETKPEKIIDRLVAAVCNVNFSRIKGHTLTDEDWDACGALSDRFVGRKMEVIQAGGLSVTDIRSMSLAGRYDVIYVDYLQLIAPDDRKRSAVEQISQISMDLHTMAQITGITVVALSQLARPARDGKQEKAPGLHSLRQSGQIEQDADGVLLLYKEEPDNPRSRRCLKVAKNKEGEAGGILYLVLDGAHQRFRPSSATRPAPASRTPNPQTTLYELPANTPLPF